MKAIIYTEEEVLAAVEPLTQRHLRQMIEAECLTPQRSEDRDVFTDADIARLELLCELRDDLNLDEGALAIVMSLIDQLHGMRRQMKLLLRAVEAEPDATQSRINAAVRIFDSEVK